MTDQHTRGGDRRQRQQQSFQQQEPPDGMERKKGEGEPGEDLALEGGLGEEHALEPPRLLG